jgi:hypothetical protein
MVGPDALLLRKIGDRLNFLYPPPPTVRLHEVGGPAACSGLVNIHHDVDTPVLEGVRHAHVAAASRH